MNSCIAYCLTLIAAVATAVDDVPSPPLAPPQAQILAKVNFQQRLDNQTPIESELRDESGNAVTLQDCIAGKPTIIVLAYFRCPMLCNQVLSGLTRTLRGVNFRPGKDISVVVVSFDPTETPEMAAAKKSNIVEAYRPSDDGAGWHFLTGDEETVRAIADSVGFHYVYDDKTKQYAHASGIVLLTPTGRVSRYFYGIDYPTRDVRMGLVEASAGQIGSAVDELLLLCFHYDPLTGRYGLAIMQLIRAASVALVVGLVGFIGYSLRQERAQQRAALADAPHFRPEA